MKTLRFVMLAAFVAMLCQSCFADPFVDHFPGRTYEFVTSVNGYGAYMQFFEPSALTATTSIPISSMQQITLSGNAHGLTLTNFTIFDPASPDLSIQYGFSDGTEITITDWPGNHDNGGNYYDIAADSPEPAGLILLSSGLLGLGGAVRKKWIT